MDEIQNKPKNGNIKGESTGKAEVNKMENRKIVEKIKSTAGALRRSI